MSAYYNENDLFVAAWLRELIKAGHIAPGEVDERSIAEVEAADLKGFTQCHFFAGIGVWSYALKSAGWSDDLAVWTGSCPCQSFSASGKRGGFSDSRHLWPAWFRLIRECRPDTIFGEQVASNDGLAWLDVVSADLEGAGYTIGAADLCAAGFGAPHIRQRLYFVADAQRERVCALRPRQDDGAAGKVQGEARERERLRIDAGERGTNGRMADAAESRRTRAREHRGGPSPLPARPEQCSDDGELGHASGPGLERHAGDERDGNQPGRERADQTRYAATASGADNPKSKIGNPKFTNGFWADAEWLWCRDQKYRPVEPGTFPLVTGAPSRVGRLRGYGNALCAEVAKGFIQTYMTLKVGKLPVGVVWRARE